MSAKGEDAEEDRGGIKASLLHVLGEVNRNLYIPSVTKGKRIW
jgi:hypothetical protein